jgi:hydroxymethylpyrimidine/phosphomethylpyrimidine kinase
MQCVLSIAGSDPTGGAGLQADLQVCHAFGVHGAAIPSALTVQDGLHVRQVLPVFPSVILEQVRSTLAALKPAAIKIGMLASDDVVRNVTLALAAARAVPVVVDPVLASSDGTPLLERRAYRALRDLLHGRCLVTPNWPEMEMLAERSLPRRRDGEAAARELLEDLALEAVLLKGGHLEGDAADLLVRRASRDDGGEIEMEWLPGDRLPGPPVHGTGCALSTAIAAGLALGHPLREAVVNARRFVVRAIAHARLLDNGARILAFT